MKISLIRLSICGAVAGAMLGWSSVAWAGDEGDLLKQAQDLVHQAWNPGGNPPSNDQRTQLLTKALELTKAEPDHHLHRNRLEAMRLMRAALEEIKIGDPNNKVTADLQDADRALREAIEDAQAH